MTTINPHTTRANGTILTATIYNTDHANHVSNAQALNADKIEGATPPVVDGHAVLFDGTSGAAIRSAGGAPLLTSELPWQVAEGGTGATTAADARTNLGAAVSTVGQGKHTIWIPASAMTPRITNGAAPGLFDSGSNDNTISTLDFDQTTAESAQFVIGMPKGWNEGTVTFQHLWTASAGSAAQTFILQLAGAAISNDDSLNAAMGTAGSVSDALIATSDLHISDESSAVTIGGTVAELDMVLFTLTRDVTNDNLAADARLIGIRLFYTTNADTDA